MKLKMLWRRRVEPRIPRAQKKAEEKSAMTAVRAVASAAGSPIRKAATARPPP